MHFILIHLHIPPSLGSQTFLCHCLCLIKYKSFEKLAGKTMNPLSNECYTLIVATGQFGLVTFGNADSVDVRSEMSVRYECEYSYECLFVFAFPCTLFSTLFPSLHPCAMRQTAGNFPLNVLDTRDFQWGNRRRARGCCRGYFLLAGYGSCSCSRLNRWRCICVAAYLACYLSDRMRW